MVNQSKVEDARFWKKWKDSGAVGSLTRCDEDCFYYGIFGGETTCDAKDYGWGFYNEPVKAKRPCLHPDRKKFPSQTFVVSSLGFCAALGEDPTLIVGGKDDNTKLVEVLTGIQVA